MMKHAFTLRICTRALPADDGRQHGCLFWGGHLHAFAVFRMFIELLGHSTLDNLAGEACKVPFILQHFQPAGSDRRYLGDEGQGWSILLQPGACAQGLT